MHFQVMVGLYGFRPLIHTQRNRTTVLTSSIDHGSDEFWCPIFKLLIIILFLLVRGNEMAQVDQYTAAIQLFTEAISLDPTDFR